MGQQISGKTTWAMLLQIRQYYDKGS